MPPREWQVAWMDSAARQRARIRRLIALGAVLVFGGLAGVGWFLGEDLGLSERTELAVVVLLGSLAAVAYVIAIGLDTAAQARFRQELLESKATSGVTEAMADLSETPSLAQLIRANQMQMEKYDVLARGQAKSSYRNSQIAIGIGLLVLISGAIAALLADNTASKVTTATLTAVGGVLAGYISRTFLRTYERALAQLNFYFEQPLINSYILSAERLILDMSKGQRDPAFADLVRSLVAVLIRPHGALVDAAGDRSAPSSSSNVRGSPEQGNVA